ncbi:MAG: flagellar biosynthesis protein FlhF [Lachnospiraceae bacterium]|nr:flagellar biosynthesis protein FlhF [Lachnospiraceae bacterium]
MIIKKFVGKTEAEATAQAKKVLGQGAVVMNVRDLKKKGVIGLFAKPQVEITAAVEEIDDSKVSNEKPVQVPFAYRMEQPKTQQKPKAHLDQLIDDNSQIIKEDEESALEKDKGEDNVLEKKIEKSIQTLLEQQLKNSEKTEQVSEEEEKEPDETEKFFELIRDTLEENEVSGKYTRAFLDEMRKVVKPGVTIDFLLSSIYQKLVLKFGETRLIHKEESGPEVVFFVGPTGVGKTTTIAKIASKFCVSDHAKVALLTTDTYRVKAAEQLRTYADILNAPFRIIYEDDDLKAALEEFKNFDYILVDTAGHSPNNDEQIKTQSNFIKLAEEDFSVQVYLVLSVTTKYRDLINIVDKYSRDHSYRLIFTKLDETTALGNMLNLKIYTNADVSYITDGQDVPDDIQEFNAQKIVRSLLDSND